MVEPSSNIYWKCRYDNCGKILGCLSSSNDDISVFYNKSFICGFAFWLDHGYDVYMAIYRFWLHI
jgi:hypothetical protein